MLDMLSMKIFFQILFVWQENDLGFSPDFEKNSITDKTKQTITSKQPHSLHTHNTKFGMISVQYLDHGEKGTQIFYETIKLVDFIVKMIF